MTEQVQIKKKKNSKQIAMTIFAIFLVISMVGSTFISIFNGQPREKKLTIDETLVSAESAIDAEDGTLAYELISELPDVLSTSDQYFRRGKMYFQMQFLPEALGDFELSIDLDEGNVDPRMNRAELYLSQGEVISAIDDLNQVLNVSPKNINA